MKYLKLQMDFDKIVSRTVVVPADWSLAFLHGDIYGRVFRLVKTAATADPKSPNSCWLDYLA